MKSYNRIIIGVILLILAVFIGINTYILYLNNNKDGRNYRVEINRLENQIAEKGISKVDRKQYKCIKNIAVLKRLDDTSFFEGNGSDYVIKKIGGIYYRFDYDIQHTDEYRAIGCMVNIILGILSAAILTVLFYIQRKLLEPFHKIREIPYELSKGNLTSGLKENKNRFFGRFIWGLDLLREKLENEKKKELELQKDKKTLVLSISHDIKTPLSAIKLYASALSKNLYDSDDKRFEIAGSINAKADEIEDYVSKIIQASSEDFLSLKVCNGEFYLSELLEKIKTYYTEKLSILKINFNMEPYNNCLVKGDMERAVEVLQNVMENAIKYGDGSNIAIRVSGEEGCRLITVADSGCTLSENELPHIFESFWRGSNVGDNKGSGLGLYICRQLMKKMDGDVYAECKDDEIRVTVVLRMI